MSDKERQRRKVRYWANPEDARQKTKDWYNRNKERALKKQKEWNDLHLEHCRARRHAWYEANKARVIAAAAAWQKANPERTKELRKASTLRRKDKIAAYRAATCDQKKAYERAARYGLTPEAFNVLLQSQNGTCAICHRPETTKLHGKVRLLCVDHDHKTKHVRGLLCSACNRSIGLLGEDLDILLNAIEYLLAFKVYQ